MHQVHDHDLEAMAERDGALDPGRARDIGSRPDLEARRETTVISASGGPPGILDALSRTGRRGGAAAARRSVARLQAAAGNAAVAGLLGTSPDAHASRRVGLTFHHAGGADVLGAEPSAPVALGTGEPADDTTPLEDEGGAPVLPPPTSSSTTVGPPTSSSYTVSGTLRQAAEAVAARPEAGQTLTSPVLNMAPAGKWPVHVQVIVGQAVLLPEWDGKASATQNQRNEWDRFKAAITAHEVGHVSTDVKAYANAHGKIRAKPTRAEGNEEFDTISTQADTDNVAFDVRTDHGRNQGTSINPNIDEVTKVP